MNTILQTINNETGKPEYVLLPVSVYKVLKPRIDKILSQHTVQNDYVDFNPSDFIKNKIALARIKAKITQASLASYLKVSQAYISKIENDEYNVSEQLFLRINEAIQSIQKESRKKARKKKA